MGSEEGQEHKLSHVKTIFSQIWQLTYWEPEQEDCTIRGLPGGDHLPGVYTALGSSPQPHRNKTNFKLQK